ncbi:hypothetical protein IV38_GL001379 [Lactobacillus selangorensis]|uniref:Xylose isomerase-like TIM barrel domain-containing protein n=1 Tax=Lactobacillus selangorensis TaxID=81857 RepID=A0A0R2FUE0_9LACO|nr:TIM barrel protein [Lactobacillus selangorensis]KRN28379.1 hypothetical protein IV38_GL001379 [Lactobacillus selangorensis]KRN31880.1 hypothetical protein IV40_GL001166 [Lactobacillus selangorensis]
MTVQLGLKGSTDSAQLMDRLQFYPQVYEFHLVDTDLTTEGLQRLRDEIDQVKATATTQIVLHHPTRVHGKSLEMITAENQEPEVYRFLIDSSEKLIDLAREKDIQVLLHGAYSQKRAQHYLDAYPDIEAAQKVLFDRLDYFQRYGGRHVMFENSISPLYYYGDAEFDQFIYQKNYRLAFDTSHVFIKSHGDNDVLLAALNDLYAHIVHYHLVDSMGRKHDSLELGKGKIDWARVLPRLNPAATNIYEIGLANPNDCLPMVRSHCYARHLQEQQ